MAVYAASEEVMAKPAARSTVYWSLLNCIQTGSIEPVLYAVGALENQEKFLNGGQHDSHEFLMVMLTRLGKQTRLQHRPGNQDGDGGG